VPSARVARVVFGGVLGVVCALLMAPWDTEFGAKVGLLSGLAVMCAARPLLEHHLARRPRPVSPLVGIGGAMAVAGLIGVGIAIAGLPARGTDDPAEAAVAAGSVAEIDPASLPFVSIDPEVAGLSARLATPEGAQALAATLAWNLQVEAEALATGDASLLTAVDHGQRLEDMEASVAATADSGDRVVPTYDFDSLHLLVVFPGGFQSGPNAGLVAEGTMTEVVHDAAGGQVARPARPFATTFSLRQMTDGHWRTTDTMSPEERDD